MDLSQAEAVIDVITSENEYALQSSISQLKGSVKNRIKEIREKIIYHTAFIETALDDPEHISVDGYGEVLKEAAEEVIDQLKELIDSSDDGRIMKERDPDSNSWKTECRKVIPFEYFGGS